jgi:hypothetical protein
VADKIRVDPAGLTELSASCEAQAVAVRGTAGIPHVGNGFQATSAAVKVVHADVDTAAQLIAGRLDATAGGVTAAIAAYDETDSSSAAAIGAVGPQSATIEV